MTCNGNISEDIQNRLMKEAVKACKNAYAPYSKFNVGAAVLCEDGEIFTGCNVENASYGATLCAERNAISAAVAAGKRDFIAVAVAAGDESMALPCGICRQVLSEFNPDTTVLLCNSKGLQESFSLSELLPHAFKLK
jgi:cytidine deaminase